MNDQIYTIMRTETVTRQTYEAPETSVDVIEMERDFLQGTTITGNPLQNMDPEELYDENF